MQILVAIDSYKGSLSSMEAGRAAAEGIRRANSNADVVVRPLADGGEGTVDALVVGFGGSRRVVAVAGPREHLVDCAYGIVASGGGNPGLKTCILEMAGAAGITLLTVAERNPLHTTTYGVGEAIRDAIAQGCRRFVVGIGGSATNDGGVGMLQALGFGFHDQWGRELPRGGAALSMLASITTENVVPELKDCTFRIACDVTNPLCGPMGASAVFGPQKGATPAMVECLDAALSHYADVAIAQCNNVRIAPSAPGDGAAGGLGFAFRVFLGAELVRGVDLILAETGLEEDVRAADIVVTGEGRLDAQTVMGKAPIGVAALAKKHGKPVIAFSGCVSPDVGIVNEHGIDAFFPVVPGACSLEDALNVENARVNLTRTAEQAFRVLQLGGRL